MPKIRGIKPEFWTSEDIVSLKIETRLFFIGLWNFCDDNGVFEWKPLSLKMKIFPSDNIDTTRPLRELVESHCVHKFTHDGKEYGLILNFTKHQRPDKRYFQELIKGFTEAVFPTLGVYTTRPPRDHHTEGEGEGDSEGEIKYVHFEEFWKLYPKKTNRKGAKEKWERLKIEPDTFSAIKKSIEKLKLTEQWRKGIIPLATTWLNQERWNDEDDEKIKLTDGQKNQIIQARNGAIEWTPELKSLEAIYLEMYG